MAIIANITEFAVSTNGEQVPISNGSWVTSSSSPFGTAPLKVTNSGTPNSVYNDSGNHSLAYLKPADSTTQTVKLRIKRRSLTDGAFWHALVRVNGNNWIGAIFAGQDGGILGRISLNKCVSGTRTNIGQSDDASRINSNGAEGTLEIRVSGEAPSIQVSVYWNDVLVIGPVTVTDTALSTVGSVGFQQRAFGPESQTTGFHVVSFYAEDGAVGDPPLGTVTISDVDPGETSAIVTYSYDDTDQTGFEYRLDGGTAASLGASPATISGLTASTEYDLEVRAINANGAGSWSAVETFTTAAVVLPTVTVADPLKNNTGTLLASQTGIVASVLAAPTLASVHTLSGLTTNGSGLLAPISHASLTTGQQYHVAIKLADGSVGITGPITAS